MVALATATLLASGHGLQASTGTTERVSVDSAGNEGNYDSQLSDLSADGRFVVFESFANNLITDGNPDGNWAYDIFIRDRQTDQTSLVSQNSDGGRGNGGSNEPAISDDGRFVAFSSTASSFVPDDTNFQTDVFVKDLQTGTLERVSVDSAGNQAEGGSYASISGDGRFVGFSSYSPDLVVGDNNNQRDAFVHDQQTSVTERVSVNGAGVEGNGDSADTNFSYNGRFVAFHSSASNLVSGDSNSVTDVFVRDRFAGVTERVSISSGGAESDGWSCCSAISADGRFVVFQSSATNLVPGDANGHTDTFIRDRVLGTTELVSVDGTGSQGNGDSGFASSISGDGRFVAFHSLAANLVPGDDNYVCDNNYDFVFTDNCMDVFVRDRQNGTTTRVSVDSEGIEGNASSFLSSISDDGAAISFVSYACNLVLGDNNGGYDVFVHDLNGNGGSFSDSDCDDVLDTIESICGSDASNGGSRPERIDTSGDDDGDTLVNEGLPSGAATYDCDGDGSSGLAEAAITTSDQDPCGNNGWPADLASNNRLDIADINSFLSPLRPDGSFNKFNQALDDNGDTVIEVSMARWNLQTPPHNPTTLINIGDLNSLITGGAGSLAKPPMFGGRPAFWTDVGNGVGGCPWAP